MYIFIYLFIYIYLYVCVCVCRKPRICIPPFLSSQVAASDLTSFDRVVLATGVNPRTLGGMPGHDHPKVSNRSQ